MNEQLLRTIRLALRAAPAAALATGIVCPAALGNPGDLDPTFADVGRFVPPDVFNGAAQSVAEQDADVFFAGGDLVPSFYYETTAHGFAGRVSIDGTLDDVFDAPDLAQTLVIDTAMQPDGKIVGIGRRGDNFVVFRLERDGALDTGFGVDGIREVQDVVNGVESLVVDPAGTIVIAGWSGADLKVMRLLANGDLDDTFGTAGVFTGAADTADEQIQATPRVLRTENGGYRVTDNDYVASGVSRCRVLALTANGAVDETFGDHGYAGLAAASDVITCNSMVESPDGGLLVGGSDGLQPLLIKLIASGAPDLAFAPDGLAATTMMAVAALDVEAGTGSIAVAGNGPAGVSGFLVARLQPNGSLDPAFGTGGATWVDAPSFNGGTYPRDVTVLSNSDVVVAAGSNSSVYGGTPLVARLVGADGRDSPGVLDVMKTSVDASEGDHQAVVTVRRIGGKTGSVSVAYATRAAGPDVFDATEGDDFTATANRLTWADGDTADKQIIVPIVADGGPPEEREDFYVELSDVQGGAGLGADATAVGIAADAPAAGMFAIESGDFTVSEEDNSFQFYISREYSSSGAVSVTMTPTSGTATAGDDFRADPVVVSWADGDSEWKLVEITLVNDTSREATEQFTIELSSPTGGAVVGPRSTITVSVQDNEPPDTSGGGGGGGGGGQIGIGTLLWLGMLRWLRARR